MPLVRTAPSRHAPRRIALALSLGVAAFALSSPVAGAPMSFTGQLRVTIGSLGSFTAHGAGTANVSPGTLAFTLPAHVFPLSTTIPLTGVPPFTHLDVQFDNLSGSFAPGAGLGGGFGAAYFGMTLSGLAGLGLGTLNFDLFPIHLAGHGGTFPLPPSLTSILSTVWGAWTTGPSARVIQVGSATSSTVSIAGGDLRGPGGVGTISMVTPMTVFQGGNPLYDAPLYAELTLHFTPEPSTPALMALSALLFGLLGRRRLIREGRSGYGRSFRAG
jgi:hypothetical protein